MAVVTSSLVSALRVGFQREFQDALSSAPSQWDRLSTRVPSSSAGNTYGWIGQFPKLREWSGLLASALAYDPNVRCDHHDHAHGEGGHTCGEHGCGHHGCH